MGSRPVSEKSWHKKFRDALMAPLRPLPRGWGRGRGRPRGVVRGRLAGQRRQSAHIRPYLALQPLRTFTPNAVLSRDRREDELDALRFTIHSTPSLQQRGMKRSFPSASRMATFADRYAAFQAAALVGGSNGLVIDAPTSAPEAPSGSVDDLALLVRAEPVAGPSEVPQPQPPKPDAACKVIVSFGFNANRIGISLYVMPSA